MTQISIRFVLGLNGEPITVDCETTRDACLQAEEIIRNLTAQNIPFSTVIIQNDRVIAKEIHGYIEGLKVELFLDWTRRVIELA